MTTATGIGARLKLLRAARSQRDYAEALGVSFSAYRTYEAEQNPPPMGALVAAALDADVSLDWLILGRECCHEGTSSPRQDSEVRAACEALERIRAAGKVREFEFIRGAIALADPGIDAEKKERATGTDGGSGPSRRGR